MKRSILILFLGLVLISSINYAYSEENSYTKISEEILNSPEIFSEGIFKKITYSENSEIFIVYILDFESKNELRKKINYTLDIIDEEHTQLYDKRYLIIYEDYIEWISNTKIIHIEGVNSQKILESKLFSDYILTYNSTLNDYTKNAKIETFSTASLSVQSSECDKCGEGLFNNCDKDECYDLSSSCYLTLASCTGFGDCICNDGLNLQNGNDAFCNYKGQRKGGCLKNEYDCDSNSQCSSGLICVGTLSGEDGCCTNGEEWDDVNNLCKKNTDFQTNLTYTYGNMKYTLYRGKWNKGCISTTCSAYDWAPGKIDYTKRPVLLIHGWSNDAKHIENNPDNEWGNLQKELEDKGYQVWRLQYSPANLNAMETGGVISDAIDKLLDYGYKDFNNGKIDIVAHSFGGIVIRGYTQNLAIDKNGNQILYKENIRKLILVSSPVGGSYFANIIDDISTIKVSNHPQCKELIEDEKLTGKSEATKDMQIGSEFTWNLNTFPFNNNIDYLTISGKELLNDATILIPTKRYCLSNTWETNDGVVALYNSNLIDKNIPSVLLDKFHSSIKIPLVGTEGIDLYSNTGKIVDLFLRDSLTPSTISSFINKNSGEYYYDPKSTDEVPSQLKSGGGIVIAVKNSEIALNSLSFRPVSSTIFYNMTKNEISKKWIYVVSSDAKDNYILFLNQLPSQNYFPIINNKELANSLFIKNGIPNMIQINLDQDKDNFDLKQVGGSDCNDNNPTINPNSLEMCNDIDDNCNTNIDETFSDKGTICSVGIGECKSEGFKICSLNGQETECNAVAKNPSDEICDELDNDCNGLIDEGETCIIPKEITIISPTIDNFYSSKKIPFVINTTKPFDLEYLDNTFDTEEFLEIIKLNESKLFEGRFKKLGKNISKFDEISNFKEGIHVLTVRDINNINNSDVTLFFVDTKEPRITSLEPRKGFLNGTFEIEFIEELPQALFLYYGNPIENKAIEPFDECVLDRGKFSCNLKINLNNFDGKEIEYWTEVIDVNQKKGASKRIKLEVDTTFPKINSFDYTVDKKRVNFLFSIDEKNFEEINYIDLNEKNARRKVLCSRIKNGICEVSKSFRSGNHNLNIQVLDKAENFIEKNISFLI